MGLFDKIIKKVGKVFSDKVVASDEAPSGIGMKDGPLTKVTRNTSLNLDIPGMKEHASKVYGYRSPETKITPTPTLMPTMAKQMNVTPTSAPIQNKVMDVGVTKKQEKVPVAFYDGAEKSGAALGVPKEVILANSRWEHRNNSNWNEGKYVDNVWWNAAKNTGEESYGPGQINMRWFGPEAVKLGRITTDHPLYITPEQAKDPMGAAEWMAKKFSREAKRYTDKGLEPDWEAILQGYNSNEKDRGKNVKNLIDTTDFVRSE